jgi:hypothetical protein
MAAENAVQSPSRRSFLTATAAAAISAGIAGCGGFRHGRHTADAGPVVGGRAWRELQQRISGPVLRPWDEDFAWITLPNNLRYSGPNPQGVARCRNADDVAQSILWAREHRIPLVARSGGHSYAGYSTTNGLMIETTMMGGAKFDSTTGVVTVEGGALNSAVYDALRAENVAITHGRCPSVGAAGFVLGGGIGFNMRGNGIASDSLLESEIVTADGKRLTLSDKPSGIPDLFWACRGGGGGNFGINTSFKLQTFAVGRATVFHVVWKAPTELLASTLMEALGNAPPALGSRISFRAPSPEQRSHGEDVTVDLLGQFRNASLPELRALLEPSYKVARPSTEDIREMSYWEGQDFLSENQNPVYFQERSAFVNGPFGDEALAIAFKILRTWPGTSEYGDLRFFQTGGRMNSLSPDATAFVHRGSNWLLVVGLYWTQQDNRNERLMRANRDWQDRFYDAMLPFVGGGGAYQNFTDPSLKDWRQSYYGANLFRLARVKKDVDPDNVFEFPQAV